MTVEIFDWEHAHEAAKALRERGSVHQVTLPGGVTAWVIGNYADALAALTDEHLSKDSAGIHRILGAQLLRAGKTPELSRMFGSSSILFMDNPRHDELRRRVSKVFTLRRIQLLRPRIERLVSEMLEALPRDRPVDVIEHVAFPLPLVVICELLGVPLDERHQFRDWTTAMMEDDPDRVLPASRAMEDYFDKLILGKRASSDDGLLSALVQLAERGELSADEVMDMVFLLFVAGHETSTNLIGNGVHHLLADPRRWRLLGHRPELVAGAVEEILRFDSPVRMAPYRWTRESVQYGGVVIPADEIVLVSPLSAGRDPHQYPEADNFDVRRNATHLSFGHGIHYCLGAPLARLEAEVVFTALTRDFPNARLAAEADQLRHNPSVIMNGFSALPVIPGGR
ncbi:cytochrome P450 [Amycolatopsis sp. OK19-0408]|uniref:Cytochrome P450 n=1 Tax=Amycolatopsis iheyensis TaxID=2945988 RepID=A0A9X2NGB1_9PSEU|nr:cytochrome P450 [Amycolatopsis iheyensis]MCR6488266.1 cytochrome P450 [Amycolatopsis iheyensis]